MTTADGAWHFGIGDPTPIGSLTVMGYFLIAWVCWTGLAALDPSPGTRTTARFWPVIAIALVALGVNKQLDLETALTEIGRILAYSEGWYEQRREVQMNYIIIVAVSDVVALATLTWLCWPLSVGRALALCGATFLFGFVLIRASSFHDVDVFLSHTALGLRWNWILELSGIALIGAGSIIEKSARRIHRSSTP
jgi:hypothetical protein